tara:strand:- start:737 stop:841 length:105 start_codon:yes stop_codon:yes gene_type:complete
VAWYDQCTDRYKQRDLLLKKKIQEEMLGILIMWG